MSSPAELLDDAAEDAEDLIAAWFTKLRPSGVTRQAGDPLPFTLIRHVAGSDDPGLRISAPIVSVHTLCDKALGWPAAKAECRKTARRINLLIVYQEAIELPDGRWASIDYGECVEEPSWQPFENTQILRKVGRYQIGLSYVPAPDGSG